jgi:hypothetical protein
MGARSHACDCEPRAAYVYGRADRTLCALLAIDVAAFAAAAWLFASFPDSLEPWARNAEMAAAARVDTEVRPCP